MNSMKNSAFHTSTPAEIKAGMLTELRESIGELAEELLPELAMMFLEDTPLMFSRIHQAIVNDEAHKVKDLAHTVKGSCASMGITVLTTHCQAIENMGRNGTLKTTAARLAWARAEYEQVKIVLDAYVI